MNPYDKFSVEELRTRRDQLCGLITKSANPDTMTGRMYNADQPCTAAAEVNAIENELASRSIAATNTVEEPAHDSKPDKGSAEIPADAPDPEGSVGESESGDDQTADAADEVEHDPETSEDSGEDTIGLADITTDGPDPTWLSRMQSGGDLQSKIDAVTERNG